MNEKDFAGLLQGVKEMTAYIKWEPVAGAVETRIPDTDVHSTRPTGPARALLPIFERNPVVRWRRCAPDCVKTDE